MVKINKYICLFKNLLSKGSLIHLIVLIGIKKIHCTVYKWCGLNIDHSVIWIKSKNIFEVQGKITV